MPFKFKSKERVCLRNVDGALGKNAPVGIVLRREKISWQNWYVVEFGRGNSLSRCPESSLIQAPSTKRKTWQRT